MKTVCPLDCPDLCALDVTVDDAGRIAKVAAGTGTPITGGVICGKVRDIADHVYGDDRIRTPLIRDAAGTLQPATWDAALDGTAQNVGSSWVAPSRRNRRVASPPSVSQPLEPP